jgi:hypothetical protein
METTIATVALALYLVTAPLLYRLFRSPKRPRWLTGELSGEYLILAHIAALLVGVSFGLSAYLE